MPYPLPLTRTEAYLAYKAGVIQQSDLKPSLAVPRNGIDAWLAYWTGLAADYPKREDGTPHILQEEEAYIAYLCGVINEYPEKCLRRVGAYLRYLISARWGRPDHPLNREELYLSLIKTQFIPSGDPSSDIVINGTAKAPFVDVKMYGDTFQQSYTGKNLFVPPESTTSRGVTYTRNDDGSFDISGTATGGESLASIFTDINLQDGDSLTLSSNVASSTGVVYRVGAYNGNSWLASLISQASTMPRTITIPSNATRLRYSIGVRENRTVELNNVTFQLEKGTATSYEPYVGGIPSPSPDYPQPIQTVTGEQVVKVEGKNLLNLADKTTTERGVSINMSNGNVLSLDGTATSTGDSFYYYSANIKITQDSVLSGNVLGGTAVDGALLVLKLRIQRSDGTGYWASIKVGEQMQLHEGLTIAQFYLGLTSGTVFTNYKVGIQLEKGSTATAYTPYSSTDYPISLGSIELCKIGTYQDYIWKDGDEWKVHKATVKKILTGSENWSDATVESTTGYFRGSVSLGGYKTTLGYSNKILVRQGSHGAYEYVWLQNLGTGNTYLQVLKSRLSASTLEAFETWLASNNITIYAVPYDDQADTTITDTNLIAQLEALLAGGAENGTTYITVDATDPNLPGLLYVEAPKYE